MGGPVLEFWLVYCPNLDLYSTVRVWINVLKETNSRDSNNLELFIVLFKNKKYPIVFGNIWHSGIQENHKIYWFLKSSFKMWLHDGIKYVFTCTGYLDSLFNGKVVLLPDFCYNKVKNKTSIFLKNNCQLKFFWLIEKSEHYKIKIRTL